MIHAIADTHVLIWHLFDSTRLSNAAMRALDFALDDQKMIGISAISLVEIVYLIEKRRIPKDALSLLAEKLQKPRSLFEIIPLTYSIAEDVAKIPYNQISDMPDRIRCNSITPQHSPH